MRRNKRIVTANGHDIAGLSEIYKIVIDLLLSIILIINLVHYYRHC